MKLQPDKPENWSIHAYGEGWVSVNGERHSQSLVISSHGSLQAWDCQRFEDLQTHHFDLLVASEPEIVLFGSGSRLRFAHPGLLRNLLDRQIGVETMDTLAACRTYNILAGEGRRVVAALLVEPV